jgi:hypothetical protein
MLVIPRGLQTRSVTSTKRAAGAPHPYVIGGKSVQAYFAIAEHCARAGKLRLP